MQFPDEELCRAPSEGGRRHCPAKLKGNRDPPQGVAATSQSLCRVTGSGLRLLASSVGVHEALTSLVRPSAISHTQVRRILGKASGTEVASGLLGTGGPSTFFFSLRSCRPFSPGHHLGKEIEGMAWNPNWAQLAVEGG